MRYFTQNFINNTLKNTSIQRGRRKFVVKLINIQSALTLIIVICAIWGFNQDKIPLFLGSILAVLGVAFFAQWSLLSNVTAGLILFFHHPAKIGDRIKILDKDFPIDGETSMIHYNSNTDENSSCEFHPTYLK
jgi:small-conductance mechanosensitive channel